MISQLPALHPKQIILRRVKIPLHEPFRISSGAVSEKECIVVEMRADQAVGFGEASPMGGSFYSADTPDSTWKALAEQMVPRLAGSEKLRLQDLLSVFEETPGEPFAKAGLEGAFWDAGAQHLGRPLFELLGGRRRPIPSGVAIGIYPSLEELLARVERYMREGYQRVKIKIQPGWDIGPVRAVRERFGPVPLMVDANAAYTLRDATVFEQLDRFDLMMIEQPMAADALEEHAELQRRIRTPVCLDESAESLDALREILRLGSGRIVNIKVQRVGGLFNARQMHESCMQAGVPCWLGTMPELGIASAQGLHLGTLENFIWPTDVEASARWFADDIIDPLITVNRQGWIHLPEGPGMGYRVDREKLQKYSTDTMVFDL